MIAQVSIVFNLAAQPATGKCSCLGGGRRVRSHGVTHKFSSINIFLFAK